MHEGDDDAVEFSNIKRVASLLAQGIKFIEKKNAGCGFREVEELPQVNRRLPKIGTNDGIKTDRPTARPSGH